MSPCDTALWSLIDRYFATTQDVFESSSIATTKGAFTIPRVRVRVKVQLWIIWPEFD